MITYNKTRISSVRIDDDYYDGKKKKRIKYAKPKITKKLLFEDDLYDLGELYRQIRNAHDRDPYHKIEVTFNSTLDY